MVQVRIPHLGIDKLACQAESEGILPQGGKILVGHPAVDFFVLWVECGPAERSDADLYQDKHTPRYQIILCFSKLLHKIFFVV